MSDPIEVLDPVPAALPGRRSVLTVVVALGLAVVLAAAGWGLLHRNRSTAEPSPRAEGYRSYGTVAGTEFWVKSFGPDQMAVRTTGRLAGVCNNLGPSNIPYSDVCGGAITGTGTIFAYVVSDAVTMVSVPISDGTAATQSGSVDIGAVRPGRHLLVVIVPGVAVFSSGPPQFATAAH